MRVLLTGSCGFLGRHVSEYLRGKGFDVTGLDLTDGAEVKADVTDYESISKALQERGFDAIVHLAALTDIRYTTENPYPTYRVNCFGTLNMLEFAVRKGTERFLYASSANVYGAPSELPVREATPFNPRLPYDYSKVISEKLVESYSIHKKLKTTITRSWLLFGEGEGRNRAIPRFIRACLSDQKIPLFNAGRDVTDPSHAMNYARAVELILTKEEAAGQQFNFGSGRMMSIREVAEVVKKVTSSHSELELLPPRTEFEKEPQVSYPSIDNLRKKLGYEPVVSFEEGIRRSVEWIKKSM